MLMRDSELCVVHVAALGDQEALETLWRTTQVIAAQGLGQVLVALDEGRGTDATWTAAVAAEVRRLCCSGLSVLGRIRALQAEFSKVLRENSLYALHLHGLVPCLLGSQALKRSPLQGRVLYSPHRSRFGSAWSAALLGRLLQSESLPLHYAAVTGSLTEAQVLSKLLNRSAEVLPQPVSDAFFAALRHEETRPTILADGSGAEAVDLVTRLCVLFNGRDARVRFSWLGAAEPGARAQLEAAGVTVLGAADDGARAQSLSRAWLFIRVSLRDRFPLAVAQAMAAGTPCLVSDTAAHRALVRHGETGFVCTSDRDFVETAVLLLRDRAERRRIGEAARAEAGRQFTSRHFEAAILRAYGFTGSRALQAANMVAVSKQSFVPGLMS